MTKYVFFMFTILMELLKSAGSRDRGEMEDKGDNPLGMGEAEGFLPRW